MRLVEFQAVDKKKCSFDEKVWGAQVEGVRGDVGAPQEKRLRVSILQVASVLTPVTVRELDATLGHSNFCKLFKRPLFCVFSEVYQAANTDRHKLDSLAPLTPEGKQELVISSVLTLIEV